MHIPGQTNEGRMHVGNLGKYLIGMAAGAALLGGAGLAYSAAGTAKYEPCKLTQPAPGVTQLCEMDGGASALGHTGSAANASNPGAGGGSASITITSSGSGGGQPKS